MVNSRMICQADLRTRELEARLAPQRRSKRRLLTIMSVGVLSLSACSVTESRDTPSPVESNVPSTSASPSASATATDASAPVFDPPLQFDTLAALPVADDVWDGKITLGGSSSGLPLVFAGPHAYLSTDFGLERIDLATGVSDLSILASDEGIDQDNSLFGEREVYAPILTTFDDGVQKAVTAVPVNVNGEGTRPDVSALRVLHMDTADTEPDLLAGEQASHSIDLPAWASDGYGNLTARVLGERGGVVGVTASDGDNTWLAAVDVGTGAVLWQRDDLGVPTFTGNDVILATRDDLYSDGVTTAVDLLGGETAWTLDGGYGSYVAGAGPNFALHNVDGRSRLLDVHTGEEVRAWENGESWSCQYDQTSVLVCASSSGGLYALDAASGDGLWSLPDEASGRIAPRATYVWHGAIYGATENGPLVLDARTGEDRELYPGITVYAANERAGVGREGSGDIMIYPAVG